MAGDVADHVKGSNLIILCHDNLRQTELLS